MKDQEEPMMNHEYGNSFVGCLYWCALFVVGAIVLICCVAFG